MGWFGKQVEDAIRNILTDIKEALLGFRTTFSRRFSPNCRRPCTGIQLPIHRRRRHSRECTMAEPLRGFLSPVYPAVDDNVTHRRVRVHRSPVRFDQSLSAKAAPQAHRARVHGFVRLVPTRIDPAPVRRCDRTHTCSNQRYVGGVRESHRVWCRWPLRRSRHGSRFELPTYRRCPSSTVSAGWASSC